MSIEAGSRDGFDFAGAGLPNLARAESADDIKQWLRQLLPDAAPENIGAQAEYYWALGHLITENDYILVHQEGHYRLGEVTGPYRHEANAGFHVIPVVWLPAPMAGEKLAAFAGHFGNGTVSEITDSEIVAILHRGIPALHRRGPIFFRWLGIVTLLSELVYFWPRAHN